MNARQRRTSRRRLLRAGVYVPRSLWARQLVHLVVTAELDHISLNSDGSLTPGWRSRTEPSVRPVEPVEQQQKHSGRSALRSAGRAFEFTFSFGADYE